MEKINFWLVGQLITIVGALAALVYLVVLDEMTLSTAFLALIGISILCAVESEQYNAE